jgi:hypothetical protein
VADFVFNIAKGKVAEHAARVLAGDPADAALLVVPVAATGIETDAVLKDMNTLAAVFAGATNEATAGGWNRKTLDETSGITVTVDDSGDRVDVDISDQTWDEVATGNNVGAVIVAYTPDSTVSDDTTVIPLTKHDFAISTDGSDVTLQIDPSGFFGAS